MKRCPATRPGWFSKRRESAGRIRYLSRDEYNRVCDAIRKLFPSHLPEFVVSVNTGMRLTEQYSATWSQVDESRRAIDLTQTKNGTARTIHLNADALAAIESLRHPGQKPADRSSPGVGPKTGSIPALGLCLAWKRRRSRDTFGIATGTRSAHGWQWPGQPSKRFRS